MSIHVALYHKTQYTYDRPASHGPHVVRLRPAPHCRTRILSYSQHVSGEHFVNWLQDPFSNWNARLVFPEKMKELWNPWVEPWFPDGVNDPDLGLLEVTVEDAEYWDAPSSKTQRLFGLARALSTGQTDRLGEHGTIHRPQ